MMTEIKIGLCIVSAVYLFFFVVIAPFAYFEGSAKSDWLKQAQGVDIPWHRACWLKVQINSFNGNVNIGQ